jgi:uncharacterized protein (DUF433 family)
MICRDRITVDPNESQGKACIRGTRILVSVESDNLATGAHQDKIHLSYPRLAYKDKAVSL